jgi:hypothetical protein
MCDLRLDRFFYIKQHQPGYFHVVIEDTANNFIAAAGTIFIEEKFIRHLGRVLFTVDQTLHCTNHGI